MKIICAWSPPPGWVRKSGQSFLEALPVFARGRMPVCICAEAGASEGDRVTD